MTTAVAPKAVPSWLLAMLGAVVFLANAGLLVLQLVAPRYLAPFIGSSVETWTCVIGVFLTGIALGNHFGGRLADRSPATRTLGILLALGGVSALLMIGVALICQTTGFDRAFPLGPRIPILAALFCLPPAVVLSLMTPLTIKLMLPDVSKAGRVAGMVFALSTVGCLVGNYATGFWFMADYTLNAITVGVAVGLFVLAVPMVWVNYRLLPAAPWGGTPRAATEDDPLGFRRDIRRAFAVVFVASFCGMSLELTASRLLAPIIGISLYTWTGIIGVMLAGTACGNYIGGILADRGVRPALERFALLMGAFLGFAAGPAFLRSLRLDGFPAAESSTVWVVRVVAAAVGVWAVILLNRAVTPGRSWLPYLAVGAVLGWAAAHPVVRSLLSIFAKGQADAGGPFPGLTGAGFDGGSFLVHLLGAVVGAGIAFGLGYDPKTVDRPATRQGALAMCLFGAAVSTGIIVIVLGMTQRPELGLYDVIFGADLIWNVLAVTFLVFFLPMLCLGTVSPQVIRMSITDTAVAGRTAGTVYAWSTAGAIVGTFAAGYLLIDLLGMNRVVFILGTVLIVLAVVLGRFWQNTSLLFVGSILFAFALGGLFFFPALTGRSFTAESKYYAIQVSAYYENDGREGADRKLLFKTLSLDHLLHSSVKLDNPYWLYYPHEYIQGEIVQSAHRRATPEKPAQVLVIGGGGYTFPRYVDTLYPRAHVDVVEIDPAVTEVAHRHLGLARDTKIRSYHMDGRQFVRETAAKGHYHVVIQDAVNDLSVPWHLMTKEYNDAIKATLAEDGVYLLTIIDSIESGSLWRAAVNTMRQTFDHVELMDPEGFVEDKDGRLGGQHVYVIYGADHPLPLAEITADAKEWDRRRAAGLAAAAAAPLVELGPARAMAGWLADRPAYSHTLDRPRLDRHLKAGKTIVLTDQYAPVDNLMSDVFRNR